jgi:DNA polymerase III epsilon subunit family exonuclease
VGGFFDFLKNLFIPRKKNNIDTHNLQTQPKPERTKLSEKSCGNNIDTCNLLPQPKLKKIKLSEEPGPIEEFVIIDIETTGLDSRLDKIVELAGIKIKQGEIVDSFCSLVNPGIPIPKEATNIHHITDRMVKNAPRINEVLPKFLDFIGELPVGGHNIKFDYDFIQYNAYLLGKTFTNPYFDTLSLSRKAFPKLKNHKLGTLIDHLKIDVKRQHRALDDVIATAQIYFKCCKVLKETQTTPKPIGLSNNENIAFGIIKQVLRNHNIEPNQICYDKSSTCVLINYSISFPRWFLKIKLDGKKKYIVTNLETNYIKSMINGFDVEDCPKSISGRSRVLINSPEDLNRLDKIIVECFNEVEREYQQYQKYYNSPRVYEITIKV